MAVSLRHTKVGQGPDLVILHGLFGSSSNWRNITNALASHFTVYLPDARNHGESPWSELMDYENMVNDVARLFDRNGISKAHFIGHSMGGKTAMTFALKFPNNVKKLIIVDISPKAYQHFDTHKHYIQSMLDLNLHSLTGGRKQAELQLTEKLNETKVVIQFLLQNLVYKNNQFRWRINLPILSQSLTGLLDKINFNEKTQSQICSLFLYGKNSDYLKPSDHVLIKKLFPNSVIEGMDNAGHWLHAEQPLQFVQIVKQFLTQDQDDI